MVNRDLQSVLQQAMSIERDGFAFYRLAAEQADDPGARAMFSRLADEERKHYQELQNGCRSLAEGTAWKPSVTRSDRPTPAAGPIFSPAFVRRIGGKHFEMSALSIGILLEKNAYVFYRQRAEEVEDEALAAFFRELAAWEASHHRLLLREDEAMKEAYWRENRFEPLL